MKRREMIVADDGYMLTNGDIYGKVIFLAEGQSSSGFHEITEEEYRKILEKQESNNIR